MPIPAYVDALQQHVVPLDKDWFAYKLSEPASQRTVADTLTARTGMTWDPEDMAMTNGGFAAIAVALRTLVEPGDEVLFLSPPWFFYEILILAAAASRCGSRCGPRRFDLDVDRIAAAIGRARVPCSSTARTTRPAASTAREALASLASALADASTRIGHPIWIISDEPYNRIVFDGRRPLGARRSSTRTPSITYSYGKTLLAPGQRIGFLTVPPTLPERAELRGRRSSCSRSPPAYAWPNAVAAARVGRPR